MKKIMTAVVCVILLATMASLSYEDTNLNVCLQYMTTNYPNSTWVLQDDSNGQGVYIKNWSSGLAKPTLAEAYSVWSLAEPWAIARDFELRKTVYWTNLVNDIDMYAPLLDTYTNSVSAVSDNATRKALNDAKNLIKKLQDEIKDLKVIIGKLNKYE
jgi:hypothetical protein